MEAERGIERQREEEGGRERQRREEGGRVRQREIWGRRGRHRWRERDGVGTYAAHKFVEDIVNHVVDFITCRLKFTAIHFSIHLLLIRFLATETNEEKKTNKTTFANDEKQKPSEKLSQLNNKNHPRKSRTTGVQKN